MNIIDSIEMEKRGFESPSGLTQQEGQDESLHSCVRGVSSRQKQQGDIKKRFQKNFHQLRMKKAVEIPELSNFALKEEEDQEIAFNPKCIQEKVKAFVHSSLFERSFIIFLFLFFVSALLWDPVSNQNSSTIVEMIQLACHFIFLIFFICRVIEWESQKIFWLIVDFLTIVAGITGAFLQEQETIRYFKAFRVLRLIFLIKEIDFLSQPASKLMKALTKTGSLIIPFLVIIYIYAVVGLYSFNSLEYNKCRTPDNINLPSQWTAYDEQIFLCGQRQCPVVSDQQLLCLNPIDYGVEPNKAQLVNVVQGNGLLQYSNIFYAFLSTFKQTYVTGSSRLIILYKQVLNPIFVEVYHYTYIYLISYIYLNIFYGLIITSEWDTYEDQEETEANKSAKIKNDFNINEEVKEMNSNADPKKRVKTIIKVKDGEISQQSLRMSKSKPQQSTIRESTIKEGDLILQKARINNVFEDVQDQQKDWGSVEGKQQQQQDQVVKTSTLEEQSPKIFKSYAIANTTTVILCCINLSLEFHDQSEDFKYVVDCIDFAFYVLMIVQIGIRIALERLYLRKIGVQTKLTMGIVLICTGGVIYEAIVSKDTNDFFSAGTKIQGLIRSVKYLRLFVMILESPFFKEAKIILKLTFLSLYKIKNVVALWVMIMIILSIMGFHLHSYKTKVDQNGNLDLENGTGLQISFDGMFNSMIFTMLTFYNEEWDHLMFQQYLGAEALIVIWQLITLTVGLILFSKYFMAMLMKELGQMMDQNPSQDDEIGNMVDGDGEQSVSQNNGNNKVNPYQYKRVTFGLLNGQDSTAKVKEEKNQNSGQEEKDVPTSLCIKRFLSVLKRGIEHRIYKTIFIIQILLTCIVLISITPHIDRNSEEVAPYFVIDYITKAFFIIDLLFNLLVYGLLRDEGSYLRKSWIHWVNIAIIIIEIISLTSLGSDKIFMKIQKIKVIRLIFFVELRYKQDWNMRMTFQSFIQLLPKVITLLAVTLAMYSYFALVFVKMYKNDFFSCSNSHEGASIVTKEDCFNWGGDWTQPSINTSNLLNSTMFLFLVATTQGWISLMTPMMNIVGDGYEPILDSNKYISIFFVLFFFFGNLVMLNVFVGLTVSNFKTLKDKTTGESKLSRKEKMWLNIKSQISRLQPLNLQTRPEFPIRGYSYDLATKPIYKIIQGIFFITFLITMSLFKTNMTTEQIDLFSYFQLAFLVVLFIEYLIEFLAFGIRKDYRKSFIFKTIVLIYGIVYTIIFYTVKISNLQNRVFGGIFIALQFFRYLSLLDDIPFARKLLNSLVTILPQTSNILLLICITLFVYAIIGMEFFSFLRPNVELDQFNQNYTNFSSALFALIKFSTMESPIQQIADASQGMSPNFICEEIYSYDDYLIYGQKGCGSKALSYIFFLSFHIFYSLVLMSTLMAVIVESYGNIKWEQNMFITKFVLEKVTKAWANIDPQATGYIPYRQFWMFTAKLIEIYVGQDPKKSEASDSIKQLFSSKEEFLKNMAIPIYQNENGVLCFQFHEVIEALTRIYIENSIGVQVKSRKAQKMFKERQSDLKNLFKKSFYTSSHVATLIILKSGLRFWKKLATNQIGRLEYKNMIQKFSQDNKKGQDQ